MNLRPFIMSVLVAMCACEMADAGKIVIKSKRNKVESEGLDTECAGRKTKRYQGTVFSVTTRRPASITLQQGEARRTFTLASNCQITVAGNSDATLLDLKLGQQVEVAYFTTKLGTDVACSIGPPKAAAATGRKKPSP